MSAVQALCGGWLRKREVRSWRIAFPAYCWTALRAAWSNSLSLKRFIDCHNDPDDPYNLDPHEAVCSLCCAFQFKNGVRFLRTTSPHLLSNLARGENCGWQKQIHFDAAHSFCKHEFGILGIGINSMGAHFNPVSLSIVNSWTRSQKPQSERAWRQRLRGCTVYTRMSTFAMLRTAAFVQWWRRLSKEPMGVPCESSYLPRMSTMPIFTLINPPVTIPLLSLLSVRILSAIAFPFSSAPIILVAIKLEVWSIVHLHSKYLETILNCSKSFQNFPKCSELFHISRQRLRSRSSPSGNTLIVRKTIRSFISINSSLASWTRPLSRFKPYLRSNWPGSCAVSERIAPQHGMRILGPVNMEITPTLQQAIVGLVPRLVVRSVGAVMPLYAPLHSWDRRYYAPCVHARLRPIHG